MGDAAPPPPPLSALCLGLQLLAQAMDGEVGLAKAAEVGFGKVELTTLG